MQQLTNKADMQKYRSTDILCTDDMHFHRTQLEMPQQLQEADITRLQLVVYRELCPSTYNPVII
jgi:hypothetical protein